ncbi:hypothetical protein [Micromonospora echinospora]|uniref:hypothetical protein n=1 Tax=Micromonospora echinospora TaxID=1877 RepID=UPI003A8AE7F9
MRGAHSSFTCFRIRSLDWSRGRATARAASHARSNAAREALLRAYAGDRVGLCLFLAALMLDADADLRALHPAEPPAPAELFRRFLRWASRPHRAPPSW